MKTHEQFAEDMILYVLSELDATHCEEFRAHLTSCAECRAEYQELVNDSALLALSVSGATPPTRARARVLAAIGQEPRLTRIVQSRPRWWSLAPIFATAAIAIFAILLMGQLFEYRGRVLDLQQQHAADQQRSDRANEILATLSDPSAVHISLVAANALPQPHGRVIYVSKTGRLLFIASNCRPLPANKVYELWLLPKDNKLPIPAGTFAPDARGMATVVFPTLPSGLEAKAFAITVEPQGGSTSPTMPIVMLGQ